MGFKTKEEVIAAGMDFANECYAIADEYNEYLGMSYYELRVENQRIEFEWLHDAESVEEAVAHCSEANCTVEELTDEEFTDGVILCEGFLYEALYSYQGGQNYSEFSKEVTKALYERLGDVLEQHGFRLNLSRTGSILLECEESTDAQLKRDFGIE